MRAGDRLRFPERPEDPDSAYVFESLDYETTGREMNAYLAEFHQGKASRAHAHDASEFLFGLSGELCVTVEANDHFLAAGDSIYIRPSVPHAYAAGGGEPCRVVLVTTAAPASAVRPSSTRSVFLA